MSSFLASHEGQTFLRNFQLSECRKLVDHGQEFVSVSWLWMAIFKLHFIGQKSHDLLCQLLKAALWDRIRATPLVWSECSRLIANCIIFYNATLLSKLLAHKESRGDMQGAALDVDEIVRELAEIWTGTRSLWRRDPGLNLFAGICKKPQIAEAYLPQIVALLQNRNPTVKETGVSAVRATSESAKAASGRPLPAERLQIKPPVVSFYF